MINRQNESAVSETISTVLAVALTVILASLVAAYMFGMMPNIPISRTLAYSAAQPDADTIVITYHGGPDARSLNWATVEVSPPGGGAVTYWNSSPLVPAITVPPSDITDMNIDNKVGSIMTVTKAGGGFINKDHVVVTGHFDNGQDQVVLDMLI